MTDLSTTTLSCISVDENFISIFTEKQFKLSSHGDLWISEQQAAVNFRHRKSPSHYISDWHVAGDPTLIIVCSGTLKLELRDGSSKSFSPGEKFIAEDYLPKEHVFDDAIHGHRAMVIGNEPFTAIHIKLEKLNN